MRMNSNSTTIFQTCRQAAGITQERAAELLGISVRTLAAYESGERPVPPLRAADMVDLYGTQYLAMQYLRLYAPFASEILPSVERVPLAQAVCQLMITIEKIQQARVGNRLMQIAADGKVDELEEQDFEEVMAILSPLVRDVMALRYAEEV